MVALALRQRELTNSELAERLKSLEADLREERARARDEFEHSLGRLRLDFATDRLAAENQGSRQREKLAPELELEEEVARAKRDLVAPKLTREDALNYAHLYAADRHLRGGWVARCAAVGLSTAAFAKLYVNSEIFVSQRNLPSDDAPSEMVALLLELIRSNQAGSNELPELAIGGAWRGVVNCLMGRAAVCRRAVECGAFELIMVCLSGLGGPLEWLRFGEEPGSGGDGRVTYATQAAATIVRCDTQLLRSERFRRSGLTEELLGAVVSLHATCHVACDGPSVMPGSLLTVRSACECSGRCTSSERSALAAVAIVTSPFRPAVMGLNPLR